jgi:uncharacterized protein with HEPN domain
LTLPERDLGYLEDVRKYAARALGHRADLSFQQFEADQARSDAVLLCLIRIGDASKRLSLEARTEFPELPWVSIIGMRNILVHEYGRVDYGRVWTVLIEELPRLRDELGAYLSRIP